MSQFRSRCRKVCSAAEQGRCSLWQEHNAGSALQTYHVVGQGRSIGGQRSKRQPREVKRRMLHGEALRSSVGGARVLWRSALRSGLLPRACCLHLSGSPG